jgi:nitrate/TMAO reductase-like tetraheme cytochrome c subunit
MNESPGLLRRLLRLKLLWGGILAGIVLWGGFNTVVEATNKEAFIARRLS